MKQPFLTLNQLNIHFKDVHAVQNVSFDIFPGETLACVGESGSGKSATANAILKLHSSHSCQVTGQILCEDQNIMTMDSKALKSFRGKKIGMIFQEPLSALNPTMKIGHQIAEGLITHEKLSNKAAHLESKDLLRKVGIPDPDQRFHQYPFEMSGGMRQRVLIAIAIACKPKLIIADEPTTALDVTIQRQIMELLMNLKAEMGMALLLITHDLGIVAGYADRVIVMRSGKIVESASVDNIFDHPQHPYTLLLLNSARKLL